MDDLIAIGDATLDVFVSVEDAKVITDNQGNKFLGLPYADKIAAKSADFIIGGNAANAAIGSRRLGLASAFLSTAGDDDTGKKIQDNFRKEGVSLEYLTIDKGQMSNYSVVLDYQAERTIIVYHVPRKYVWNVTQAPHWFYITSMGQGFEEIYKQAVEMSVKNGCAIAFNPGTHQLKEGLDFLRPTLKATTILFLNREESAELLGVANHPSITKLLEGLKTTGPKIIVLTDGPAGSYAYDGNEIYQMGIYDGPIIERTGAGDAFGTAFTVAIAEGKTIPEAIQWGTANSNSVVQFIGPEAGLLSQEGIQKIIAANPTIRPKLL